MKWRKAKWGKPEMDRIAGDAGNEMSYEHLAMTARLGGLVVKHLLRQLGGQATLTQAELVEAEREWSVAIRLEPPMGDTITAVHLRLVHEPPAGPTPGDGDKQG